MQISATMTTDLVAPRALNAMRREINHRAAKRLLSNEGPVPRRFTEAIKREIPETYYERGATYEKDKLRKFGHTTPNVRTGRLREQIGRTSVITATSSGGKLRLRPYWSGSARKKRGGKGFAKQGFSERQRQEFETLSKRELKWMAGRMKDDFISFSEDPKYRRQRAVSRGGAA